MRLSDAEISLALKHLTAWRTIAAAGYAHSLVLEDDVLLDARFAAKLEEVLRRLAHRH